MVAGEEKRGSRRQGEEGEGGRRRGKKAPSAGEDSAAFSESRGRYKDVGEAAGRRSIRLDVKTI